MKPKDAWREVRWSLSRSSLTVHCVGVSAFRFHIVSVFSLVAITTMHCTVHDMSVAWQRRVVAWARATYQYHVNGMDTVGQSVGRSVGQSVSRSVGRSMHVVP